MKCDSYNMFFEVVASKTRMRILEDLTRRPKCVSEICQTLEEEQSKISHNLKRLTDCNFLDVQKEGKKRVYSLNKETIMPLMNLVKRHAQKYCCKGCKVVR